MMFGYEKYINADGTYGGVLIPLPVPPALDAELRSAGLVPEGEIEEELDKASAQVMANCRDRVVAAREAMTPGERAFVEELAPAWQAKLGSQSASGADVPIIVKDSPAQ